MPIVADATIRVKTDKILGKHTTSGNTDGSAKLRLLVLCWAD